MTKIDLSPLDADVRSALDPEPEAALRIASHALSLPGRRRRRPFAALVVLLAVAAATAWIVLPRTASTADRAMADVPRLLILNHGVVVTAIDPSNVSLAADSVDRRPSTPSRLFIVRGGDS